MKNVFTFFALFLSTIIQGQIVISGRVTDARTKEPLANASVFCENTTIGTLTDQQGKFSLQLGEGGYNLIVSYTGYKTHKQQVTGSVGNMELGMIREDLKLKEVVIKAKSTLVSDGWATYGTYFIDNFIGTTPNAQNCSLLNREALKFHYYRNDDKIKVFATEPLKIQNDALGYILTYQLDSFVYDFNDAFFSYRGHCLYTEMEGSEKEKKNWARNRKLAYYGSILHFMRDYYKNTLNEDGWDLALQKAEDETKFEPIRDPFDSKYYQLVKDSNLVRVIFPARLKITNTKKTPEPEYLQRYNQEKGTKRQISLVDIKGSIIIKENGFYHDVMSWTTYNYWSWKNLADQLPFDYWP